MKFLRENLKSALKANGLKYSDVVTLLVENGEDISESAVKKWFITLKPTNPELKKLKILAKHLQQPISNFVEQDIFTAESNNLIFIDKLEMLAGAGAEGVFDLDFNSSLKIGIDKSILRNFNIKHIKIFECIGDSMQPDFNEGDFVFVDMVDGRDFVKINDTYIIRVGDIVQIKRVDFLGNNKIKLISLNKEYGEYYPHRDGIECEIIGKVCGKIELKKGLSFDDKGIR